MSRIAKTILIEGRKEYTVKELKNQHVLQVIGLFEQLEKTDNSSQTISDFILANLEKVLGWCSDIPIEDFQDFSLSETNQVWEGFQSANPFFFKMLTHLQIPKKVHAIISMILEMFVMGFAKSLQKLSDTDMLTPSITDGVLPK